MDIENENNLRQALQSGVNLFLGAGFSLLAKDDHGRPLVLGSELARELESHFALSNASGLTLTQITTILEKSRSEELAGYLRSRFTIGSYDNRYHVLDDVKLKITSIYTTNIDNLVYMIFSDSTHYYINDLDLRGANFNDSQAIDVVSLNGCVLDSKRRFAFSAQDLATQFRRDPGRWLSLSSRLQSHPTLFWGYSLSDAPTLEALAPETILGRPHKDKWILLHPSTDRGSIDYFRALNFQIIVGDTELMLEYLERMPSSEQGESDVRVTAPSTRQLFPSESVPALSAVPVRPITEFYSGEPPVWYDIFAGDIHRTSHHGQLRNMINSRRNVIVIGPPACGKSTLLMQVAADMDIPSHKLFTGPISVEKAHLLVRRLEGKPAVIFVDNFSDDVDGFNVLVSNSNVRVVGCDRTYNIEFVLHRLRRDGFDFLDISDIDDADVNEIVRRIPADMRLHYPRSNTHSLYAGSQQSTFEVIERYTRTPLLRNRFRAVLNELKRVDLRLLDFLGVSSYVHSCRTPVSLDMLLAYFYGSISSYEEVFAMRNQLGAMVRNYTGGYDDGLQDYYVPSSVYLAEAVMDQLDGESLKGILIRFHENVSPQLIHRFDIFRRRGFDADLVIKAFDDVVEGEQFFRQLYARDESVYLLQQGAVYLLRKHNYNESFKWIDRAITEGGERNFSIRNTRAVVMFEANIIQDVNNPLVRRTLGDSMATLADCYRSDLRKNYHVLVFARQAIRFSRILGLAEGREYLEIAKTWLDDQMKSTKWKNKELVRTQRNVQDALEGRGRLRGRSFDMDDDGSS